MQENFSNSHDENMPSGNDTGAWQRPWMMGTLSVPHRIVKTSTFEGMADSKGMARDDLFDFYERFAAGGSALIFTGSVYVSDDGQAYLHQLGAHQDECGEWLERLAKIVRNHGSRTIVQLNHGGPGISPRQMGPERVTDLSAVTEKQLRAITEDYVKAARRCQDAGTDGIQIHAAHGYLISGLLDPLKNRRADQYGGNLTNRARLLMEVYDAIRAAVGADYPLLLKIDSCDENGNCEEVVEVASMLERAGIDAVEVSLGRGKNPFPVSAQIIREYFTLGEGRARALPVRWGAWALASFIAKRRQRRYPFAEGFNLGYARQFRQRLKIPVIHCGGLHTAEGINRAITSQSCDVVSLGRALIANPDIPNQLANGEPLHPVCTFCTRCSIPMGYEPTECRDRTVAADR